MKKVLIVILVILVSLSAASYIAVKTGVVNDVAKGYVKGESIAYIEQRRADGIAHSKKLMDEIRKDNQALLDGTDSIYDAKSQRDDLGVIYMNEVATPEERKALGTKAYHSLSIIMNRLVGKGMSIEDAKKQAYILLEKDGYLNKKAKSVYEDGLPTKSLSMAMGNLYKRAMADESISEEARKQVETTKKLVKDYHK